VEGAAAALPYHREGLGQEGVEGLAGLQAAAELLGLVPELRVAQLAQGRLQAPDVGDDGPDLLELALVLGADDFGGEGVEHQAGSSVIGERRGGAPDGSMISSE